MKLSSQEEYGLRCLLQVAMHRPSGAPAQIAMIAGGEGLSPEYVAKLMRVLRQGGLVVSTRGASGGYHLARPASQITLQQVIEVLDGPLFRDSFCTSHTGQANACVHTPTECSIRTLWRWVGGALEKVLDQITVADLVAGPHTVSNALAGAPAPFRPAPGTGVGQDAPARQP
jgi:Rrf2 family protein